MKAKPDGKDARGRFAPGHPGGPGRPRRDTEREYLAALSEACPLSTWREVVSAAVEAARGGDAKAREWLSGYLLGAAEAKAQTLSALAIDEMKGRDPIERAVASTKRIDDLMDSLT